MYTKESLNSLLTRFAQSLDISDTLFDDAVTEYKALGTWLDKETPQYGISIYPQGSFALGTVVRPISERDDYDLDLVCEFQNYIGLTAESLKLNVVKPLLVRYKRIDGELVEKRRCWHAEYEDVPNFHMDVIPAISGPSSTNIYITDHDEEAGGYEFIGSNPRGYVDWFFARSKDQREALYKQYIAERKVLVAQADVENVKRFRIKTPLQRAVQLLKRHRDIMFATNNSHKKPVSIIITTISGELYRGEDNVYDALKHILDGATTYVLNHMQGNQFYIVNPSYSRENFADKWNEDPDRAKVFLDWVNRAKAELVGDHLLSKSRPDMSLHMRTVLGSGISQRVFETMAKEDESAIRGGQLRVDPKTSHLSTGGTIPVPPNHHYGS